MLGCCPLLISPAPQAACRDGRAAADGDSSEEEEDDDDGADASFSWAELRDESKWTSDDELRRTTTSSDDRSR